MKISKSKTFREEYCSTVVRIGEIYPIEGADAIAKTYVNGMSIVVRKDEVKTGDVAVYCANETSIHELFLHLNSMYDTPELNADDTKRGYINKHGRVKMIRLKGVPSYGILLEPKSIATFLNESVENVETFLNNHVGEDFDEINGERFVKVYVPPVKERNQTSKGDKRNKKLARFKMLLEGSFRLHYDTQPIAKHIGEFKPEDEVSVSVKCHGTSGIFANIITNVPTNWFKRMWRKYITHKYEFDQKYNLIYSSRNVIKNEFINPKQNSYYTSDIWGHWAKILEGNIPEDYCIYGEIVGYLPDGKEIQKGYDYGCEAFGEVKSKLMVYRVTNKGVELEIPEVIKFGEMLKEKLGDIIMSYPLLYMGTLKDLYPDLDTTTHWNENLLEKMKKDKNWLMEKHEPLCKNKVPREGVVIRKIGDEVVEAFKLKTDKFFELERDMVSAGIVDTEMEESYDE